MTSYLAPATAIVFLATAGIVSASAAEDRGKALAANSSPAPAAAEIARQALSGDKVDERLVPSADLISTQNVGISPGHAQLAAGMRVDPAAYTNAELAKMFIGEYN